MKREVKVSVLCITYNQVDYIKQCLDSLLNQTTNFEYEIIVHDDASTDGTKEIVEEYGKKYPKMIVPILEEENQYSKNKHFMFKRMLPYASGKYLAFCEGDDYWTDTTKLKRQFEYMEKNPDCALCFHNAENLYMDTGVIEKVGTNNIFGKYQTKDNRYNSGNINMSKFATQNAVPTASEFFKAKDVSNLPKCYYTAPCSDLPLEMILSNIGYAYYMPRSMSVYRRNTGHSATDEWKSDRKGSIKRAKQFIKFLDEFDEYSGYVYSENVKFLKKRYKLDIIIAQKKPFVIILNKDYRVIYKGLFGKKFWVIKLLMKSLCPKLSYDLKNMINSRTAKIKRNRQNRR